jgi:hypothetical protein
MRTSFHSLIPFLPLFSITFDCWLSKFPAAAANSGTRFNSYSSCVRSSLYSLGAAPTENTASSIVACWLTAAVCLPLSCVATTTARTHWEHRLQHLFCCCVTSERTWRVPLLHVYGPSPSNGCFCASTVLALSEYATIYYFLVHFLCKKWRVLFSGSKSMWRWYSNTIIIFLDIK